MTKEHQLLVSRDFTITCPHCGEKTPIKSKAYEATGFIYTFGMLVVDPDTGERRLYPTSGCVYQDMVDTSYCANCNRELTESQITEQVNHISQDQLESWTEDELDSLIDRKEREVEKITTDVLPGLEHLHAYPLEV